MEATNRRNLKGLFMWFAAATLFGVITEFVMLAREVYQSNRYGFPLEMDDVRRYSWVILWGCVVHYVIIGTMF